VLRAYLLYQIHGQEKVTSSHSKQTISITVFDNRSSSSVGRASGSGVLKLSTGQFKHTSIQLGDLFENYRGQLALTALLGSLVRVQPASLNYGQLLLTSNTLFG
jgi:hypothetical protein